MSDQNSTQYSENLGAVPLVAVDDQVRANAIMNWFFNGAKLVTGTDTNAPASPLQQAGPSVLGDPWGRIFTIGKTSADTAGATSTSSAAAQATSAIGTPGLLLLGLLAFLAFKH